MSDNLYWTTSIPDQEARDETKEIELKIDYELWLKNQKGDDLLLLEYLRLGHTQDEAAEHWGVTRTAITHRVVNLKNSLKAWLAGQ